ncbi:neurotensin/neuromedin N [Nematolebias whitei]|uniref:neurotensin/neuromedin N n=1 Tax=Nematolebias whitei TaxID=451745 RepID=UPI0018970CDB|nr:neurotensin/neuromedin N [Nematolebias whitei]
MQAQLACALLLCFTCGVVCTDVDQEQRALAEELLTSLFTSKIKHNRQSAPSWHASLADLCQLVGGEEEGTEEVAELSKGSLQLLDELYSLQHICHGLQRREERAKQKVYDELYKRLDVEKKEKDFYPLVRQKDQAGKDV